MQMEGNIVSLPEVMDIDLLVDETIQLYQKPALQNILLKEETKNQFNCICRQELSITHFKKLNQQCH